jgi:hypothetical protein
MTTSRVDAKSTLLTDGQVLLIGGSGEADPAELYDPATAVFSPTDSLAVDRIDFTVTLLPDGRILIAGGTTNANGGQSQDLATAELYHP